MQRHRTGIKPQSMHPKLVVKEKLQALWSLWANDADAAGMTDIYSKFWVRKEFVVGLVG